ncbi:unnamed protein product [Auanema sp. JU1783]|nr:unnamed protein product [Auanema sp. JU1783]
MFRKPKRPVAQSRQRNDEGEEESQAVLVKDGLRKKRRENPMVQTTKKKREEKTNSSSDSDSDGADFSLEHAYKADLTAAKEGPRDMGATATLDIDTERASDAQSQFERVQKQLKEGLEKDGKILYKGQAMYGAKEAKDTVKGNAASGMNRIGPVRAPSFLRQTVRWDYAPDICKDYKETGYCTFGDSCKFLHDRSDYKHGWEIEQDFEAGTLNDIDNTNYEIEEEVERLPESCYICTNPFVDPVVTRCKHYFCESCALTSFRRTKNCRVCGENTGGVFNVAKNIIAQMKGNLKARDKDSDEEDEETEEETPAETADTAEDENQDEGIADDNQEAMEDESYDENGAENPEDSEDKDDGDDNQTEEEIQHEQEIVYEDIGSQEDNEPEEDGNDVEDEEED